MLTGGNRIHTIECTVGTVQSHYQYSRFVMGKRRCHRKEEGRSNQPEETEDKEDKEEKYETKKKKTRDEE